mmetsp:Transcript_21909/g.35260  ORF Transcript_21909/g.35260 Transcript_21909/m.35260 type:complete len:123 (+) Transcript_21909:879-1247(+)
MPHSQVRLHVGLLEESFSTESTIVWWEAFVLVDMSDHGNLVVKAEATYMALKWLVSVMPPFVCTQMPILGEIAIAHLASERFYALVNSHVGIQVVYLMKRLVAESAHMWPISCMSSDVSPHS